MSKRRRVETTGSDQYTLSEINPNDGCGGHCACGPHPTDQKGPYIVFKTHMMPKAGQVPRVVICAPCAKSAVLKIERGDDVGIVGAGSLKDQAFDGGEPTEGIELASLRAIYQREAAQRGLLDTPSFDEWLADQGYTGSRPDPVTTGVDPNATSLLEARAKTSPVGMRGGPVPGGRTDDPAAQLADPGNWGTPEDFFDREDVPAPGSNEEALAFDAKMAAEDE